MGKRVDKAKVEAKKARQSAKQDKTSNKRSKKEAKESGEVDIESLLAEISLKERTRTSVSITACEQPSPRANFSMTALPNGEMLMFGGEFCDGESTVVFNDLFRWSVEKGGGEWRRVESLNTPPPRCSHQMVFFKDRVYLFGGEYATLDQFHHYRDLWSLDLKTWTWTEVKASGDVPTARSGHRMVVWRSYLLLFGGFYEALRELRFHNDLFLFSPVEERWTAVPYRAHALLPRPRSGVSLFVNPADDTLFVYGGYSKERVPGQKKEGRVHDDMWSLHLKPLLATAGSGASGGKVVLDTVGFGGRATWQKISKKGQYPSPRCGAAMVVYKNKGLVVGGVYDDEGPQHSMTSTFYADMFAFDMERKRWYQLGLKRASAGSSSSSSGGGAGKKVKRKAAAAAAAANSAGDGGDSHDEEEEDEGGDEDDAEEEEAGQPRLGEGDEEEEDLQGTGECFGYIDDSGNLCYLDLEEDGDGAVLVIPAVTPLAETGGEGEGEKEEAAAAVTVDDVVVAVGEKTAVAPAARKTPVPAAAPALVAAKSSSAQLQPQPPQPPSSSSRLVSGGSMAAGGVPSLSTYFSQRIEPSPRINPCLMIKGHTLFLYGGVTELGDVEVTLDDCWALDLNKRDHWRRVLQGNMHLLVWKGSGDDNTTEGTRSDDDSDDSDGSSDDSGDSDDSDSDDDEPRKKGTKSKSKSKSTPAHADKRRAGGMTLLGPLRAEIEDIRGRLGAADASSTPLGAGESLRQFYARTASHWSAEVVRRWHGAGGDGEPMGDKELKREGFRLAEERYNELLPVLERLTELEKEQQQEEEQAQGGDGRRGGGGGGGGDKSRHRR